MNRLSVILVIFFITMNISLLESQNSKQLTLDDCIKIGLTNSKGLKVSKSKIDFANSKSKEVDAGMLPALRVNAGYTRLSSVNPTVISAGHPTGNPMIDTIMGQIGQAFSGLFPIILNNYTFKATVTQPIFTGFRLENNSKLMEYNAGASIEDMKKDAQQLIVDIESAYWAYYGALEFKKSVDENIKQVKSHLTDIQNFFDNGLATNNEVMKVKLQLSNLELTKLDAENAVELGLINLNNTLNIPVSTNIGLLSKPEIMNDDVVDLNSAIEKANSLRPEIKAMGLRIKSGEAGVKIAESSWWPQINIFGDYYYNRPNQRIMPSQDVFSATWDLGVTIGWDLWNWNITKHQVNEAEATLEQSILGLGQMKDGITMEVSSAYLTFKKTKQKVMVTEETILQAEENFRVTKDKFDGGVAINSELLDAETSLLVSKISQISAIVDYQIAKSKFEKAIGLKDEEKYKK